MEVPRTTILRKTSRYCQSLGVGVGVCSTKTFNTGKNHVAYDVHTIDASTDRDLKIKVRGQIF